MKDLFSVLMIIGCCAFLFDYFKKKKAANLKAKNDAFKAFTSKEGRYNKINNYQHVNKDINGPKEKTIGQSSSVQGHWLEQRKVGFLLASGILFMPFIFAWFTLEKGYSNITKWIAFSWMGLIGLLVLTSRDPTYNSTKATSNQNSKTENSIRNITSKKSDNLVPEIDAEKTPIKLISKNCSFDGSTAKIIGEIQNISSKPIEKIMVLVNFRDSNGTIVSDNLGNSDLSTLNPGEKSAISGQAALNITEGSCDVKFKIFGGARLAHFEEIKSSVITKNSTVRWDILQQSIEHTFPGHICLKCGGFSFTVFSEGTTNGNIARIYMVNYVENIPGDYRTKHKRCSYAHIAYDEDYKSPADLFISWNNTRSTCTGSDQIYAGSGVITFKQQAKKFKYSGLIPE